MSTLPLLVFQNKTYLLARVPLEATPPGALEDDGGALRPLERLLVLVEGQVGAGGGRRGPRRDRRGADLGGGGRRQGEHVVVVVQPLVPRARGQVHQDHGRRALLHVCVLVHVAEEAGAVARGVTTVRLAERSVEKYFTFLHRLTKDFGMRTLRLTTLQTSKNDVLKQSTLKHASIEKIAMIIKCPPLHDFRWFVAFVIGLLTLAPVKRVKNQRKINIQQSFSIQVMTFPFRAQL